MPKHRVPRVQIVPQADDQVSFQVNGVEKMRWHFSHRYPRPHFFPVIGPSGRSVTRMGHPAAPNHDHHRSFWWGHQRVAGVNFWEERGGSQQIRQDEWIHYQDGDDEAGIVVRLGYYDAHKVRLLQQELIAVYRPLANDEGWLELQSTFTPSMPKLVLGRTNFGFLGLRVAASISSHYGEGRLTGSTGVTGEQKLFGRPAHWMDYSGPITVDAQEGITWFDHPSNPNHPTSWHVRNDGWMSAAFCLREAYTLQQKQPLRLRYGFHIHGGAVNRKTADGKQKEFVASQMWDVVKVDRPWARAFAATEISRTFSFLIVHGVFSCTNDPACLLACLS